MCSLLRLPLFGAAALLLGLAALLLTGCASASMPISSSTPTPTAARPVRIAFTADTGCQQYSVQLAEADGTNTRLVARNAVNPLFLPNGQILLTDMATAGAVVHSADGRLVRSLDRNLEGALAHDGQSFANLPFGAGSGYVEVVSLESDASRMLIAQAEDRYFWSLDWSPDDRQLALRMCEGSTCGIATVGAQGGEPRPLTTDDGDSPSWAPDGRALVYARGDGLWIISAEGTGRRQILTGKSAGLPRWAADGMIYYLDAQAGAIMRIAPDGAGPTRVVEAPIGCAWTEQRFAVQPAP